MRRLSSDWLRWLSVVFQTVCRKTFVHDCKEERRGRTSGKCLLYCTLTNQAPWFVIGSPIKVDILVYIHTCVHIYMYIYILISIAMRTYIAYLHIRINVHI